MGEVCYCKEFSPVKKYSFNVTKELAGKVIEAELHIEVCNESYDLKLKVPRIPAVPSMSIKDFFNVIDSESTSSFKITGKQYNPDTVLWQIEIWNDSIIGTVRCEAIGGLPQEGWIKPLS
jgi:hypothetical protein